MKSILELIEGKPSKAVRAMLGGMEKQSKRQWVSVNITDSPSYEFNTDPYDGDADIWFFDAGICAIQEVLSRNFEKTEDAKDIETRAEFLRVGVKELLYFEKAVNALSIGSLSEVFKYCKIKLPKTCKSLESALIHWDGSDWYDYLDSYRDLAVKLEALGY
jgi:hypothetical protein